MENNDILKNIVYISLPENMKSLDLLPVDPSILLPVEIDPDSGYADITNLSWEMIIAAMLKLMVHQPEHENLEYYRNLVFAVRPDIINEMTNAAIAKAGEKDFDIAEEIFRALISLKPDSTLSLLNLSLLHEERADSYTAIGKDELADQYNEKAFESYKLLISMSPESPDANFNFGMFYLKRSNFIKAVEHFEVFMKKSEDDRKKKRVQEILDKIRVKNEHDDLFYSAYDAIRMGREPEAIETIRKFIETEPGVWNAWFLLGWAYRRTEKWEEGAEAFMKALELGSDQLDLFNELAICLMELERFAESREYLLKALKAEPENIKILSNLGIVSMKEDNPEAAADYFKAVLKIDPDDKIASGYLSALN